MSVQELLSTHDCSVPGCPDEARERGGMCRYHQAENPPSVCKVDGCTNPSAGKGGPWARTCQQHISLEVARRQAVRHAKPAPLPVSPPQPEAKKPEAKKPTPPQTKPKAAPRSMVAPAITTGTLVELATECEAARAALTEARLRHETAVAALRAALDGAE